MKHALSLSLGLAAAFCSPAAQAQAPRTLEFTVQTTAAEPAGRALADFARVVETQTRGTLRVRLRFDALNVAPGALRQSVVTGAFLLRDDLEALCPTVGAFRVPSLFPDLTSMDRTFETMRPEFETGCGSEVTVLGWSLPGPRHLFLSRPAEPSDGRLPQVSMTEVSPGQRLYFAAGADFDPRMAASPPSNMTLGVVLAPAERGLFPRLAHMVTTPAGMDVGALVINTAALRSLSPEQQRVVREAAASTIQALTRTLRSAPSGAVTRIPESPAWTAWATASRERARTNPLLGPLMSRMQLMLGPVVPPQTSHEVVPAPGPAAPRGRSA